MAGKRGGKIYHFGGFSLDAVERRLRRGGAEIRLSSRLMDILLMLVESGGRLLLKEEIMRHVWGTEFVEESNLTVGISAIRKALGEGRGERRYIETAARRGYIFVARVSAADDPADAPPAREAGHNSEPYLLSLKGRYCWSRHGEYWVRKAIRYFEQALRISPTYAPAHTGLADSYRRLSSVYVEPCAAWPKVIESARRAMELDPSLAEPHISLGMAAFLFQHDWAAAEREFTTAIDIDPGSVLARRRYGGFLSLMGRFDEGVLEIKKAIELEPLSFQSAVNLGSAYLWAGRPDKAIEVFRQTLELSPDFPPARVGIGCAYRETGDFESAIREFQELAALIDKPAIALGFLGHAYAKSGARCEARRVLAELKELQDRWATTFSLALVHAGLGERGEAMTHLELLYEERNDRLLTLNVGAEFKELRDDLRFISLLRKIGFQKPGSAGILNAPRGPRAAPILLPPPSVAGGGPGITCAARQCRGLRCEN